MNHRSMTMMLRCLRTSRVLQSYLDGEIDPATAAKVAEHLAECGRCGLHAATYRAITRAVRARAGDVDQLALRRLHAFHRSLADTGGAPADPAPHPDRIDP